MPLAPNASGAAIRLPPHPLDRCRLSVRIAPDPFDLPRILKSDRKTRGTTGAQEPVNMNTSAKAGRAQIGFHFFGGVAAVLMALGAGCTASGGAVDRGD